MKLFTMLTSIPLTVLGTNIILPTDYVYVYEYEASDASKLDILFGIDDPVVGQYVITEQTFVKVLGITGGELVRLISDHVIQLHPAFLDGEKFMVVPYADLTHLLSVAEAEKLAALVSDEEEKLDILEDQLWMYMYK